VPLVVRAAVTAALFGLAAAQGALGAAPYTPVPLPTPAQALTRSPPLQTTAPLFELQLPGRITSREQIAVGLDPNGAPVSVIATQRLTLDATGDYAFAVQGPVLDVVPTPDSDSEPGLRQGAILWQGFSPGRRLLGARAKLRVAESAPSLPLRISIDARVDGVPLEGGSKRSGRLDLGVTLVNATTASVATFEGDGVLSDIARVLDDLRKTVEGGGPYTQNLVRVRSSGGPLPGRKARVEAPFAVQGLIRFPHGTLNEVSVVNGRRVREGIAFAGRLGDGAPLRLAVRVGGRARALSLPSVSIKATPALRISTLRPPRGQTWRGAVARRLIRTDGRTLLRTAIDTILRLARVRQYETFLANPDGYARAGADRAVYLYRTAPPAASVAPPRSAGGDGGVLVPLLLAIGGVLTAGALVVVWAHS
jgi:hypothetical protein